jgi:hypothetical protein
MALGLNYETASSGDIIPIVKYDAKAGRAFRIDRAEGNSTPTDITAIFKAVFDLENIEVGWINFNTGSAPDFQLAPVGAAMPPKPAGDQHKPGLRLLVKLSQACGGDVREIATTAKVAQRAFDMLHNDYIAQRGQHPGMLPIVSITQTLPVTTGEGQRKSTNYQPVFAIVGWAKRPADLIAKPRGAAVHANGQAATPVHGNGGMQPRPSTGSTVAAPPQQQASAPAAEEDFG